MSAPVRHIVNAIVVSHDGERWLGELIAGLRQQRRPADRILVVDTGSQDASREMLARAFSPESVLSLGPRTGFGAAVGQAVRRLPPPERDAVEWLWLLHDDCAPTPGALHEMLLLLEEVPAAAVLGPKLRSWPRGRQLLELGVTITGSGMRETSLERAEFDQGQHDIVRETLAVSTAGMLVRRDVFERLGGFDPRIKLFRDDVDFGWRAHRAGYHVITCPDAIVFHAEAGWRGARPLDAVRGARPRRADRAAAIYTLLVNCAWWALPFIALRMLLGTLLRTLGLLVAKWPDAAYDEFVAGLATLGRPDRVVAGRMRRARGRKVSRRKFRHLFPPPWIGIQHGLETLTAFLSTSTEGMGSHAGSRKRRRVVETGPVSEEAEELEGAGPGRVVWALTRPPVLLFLGLCLVALVASRDILVGGALAGGALLPAPDSAWDLWRRYVESWHPVELGSDRAAPPYILVVALLGTIFVGKIGLALNLLLLCAVPLGGLTAYLFCREVLEARPVRMWAAGTYALIPAVTGAIANGRLGTCIATILLPLLALTVVRSMRSNSWSATWSAALMLGVLTSFVPMAYVAALLLGIIACALVRPRRKVAGRVAVILLTAPVLLLPWIPTLLGNPWLLLGEAGREMPGLADPDLPGYEFVFGSPGGPGAAPFWMLGVLGPVALSALLRRDRVSGVSAAWVVAGLGAAVGIAQSRLAVQADWLPVATPAWPGFASALIIGGWIAALAYAADGVAQVFSRRSFSWRQPTAALLAIFAVAAPTIAGGWWVVRGAGDPLDRHEPALPAYLARAQISGDRPRVLVLRASEGSVSYALLRGDGARLGDSETGSDGAVLERLDTTISEMLGDSQRQDGADALAAYGVGYIYLPPPADERATGRLDTTPGLARTSAPEGGAAWRLEQPGSPMRVIGDGGRGTRELGPIEDFDLPQGPKGRRLVLAEAFDDGWKATLAGEPLKAVRHDGWAQAFELPPEGGTVHLEHTDLAHDRLVVLQGIAILLTLIFALPSRSRETDAPAYTDVRPGRHGSFDEPMPDPRPLVRASTAAAHPVEEVRR